MITLEKIDQVVERTGVRYEEAKNALENCNGDVLEAIIYLEKNAQQKQEGGSKRITVSDIMDTLKEFIHRGHVSRIIIRNEDSVLLNIPVTVGAVGLILAPVTSVLGLGAAVFTNLNVSIKDHNGRIIDINKITSERLDQLKRKGAQVKRKAESTAEDIKEAIYKQSGSHEPCSCHCDKASDTSEVIDIEQEDIQENVEE